MLADVGGVAIANRYHQSAFEDKTRRSGAFQPGLRSKWSLNEPGRLPVTPECIRCLTGSAVLVAVAAVAAAVIQYVVGGSTSINISSSRSRATVVAVGWVVVESTRRKKWCTPSPLSPSEVPPRPALPRLALPRLASPCPASPCLTLPHVTNRNLPRK